MVETIRTDRLLLVPLEIGHAAEMASVLGDPALHAFIGGAPLSADALRDHYARLVAGSPDPDVAWLNWVVQLVADRILVGTVQATVTKGGRHAEVAWIVGTPWQGRGIATEAARGLVDWLGRQGVRTVVAHVHPDHHASAAVAAAVGLTRTDVLEDGEYRWEATPV